MSSQAAGASKTKDRIRALPDKGEPHPLSSAELAWVRGDGREVLALTRRREELLIRGLAMRPPFLASVIANGMGHPNSKRNTRLGRPGEARPH